MDALDCRERAAVIERYRYLVPETRRRMPICTLTNVDEAEIDSAGYIGLIHAIDTYQSGAGATLRTWCICHIRHAVRSEIRSRTMPRTEQARFEIDGNHLSLDEPLPYGTLADLIADPAPGPHYLAARAEERAAVCRAVLSLKAQDREVILRYYGGEQTITEIAHAIGVSKGRVCQLRQRALRALRKQLKGARELVDM